VLLLALLASAPAVAEPCDEAKLKFLARELMDEAGRARSWSLAWANIYGVATVGQLAPIPLIIRQDQVEWWVGAATSAAGLAFVAMETPSVVEEGPRFGARATSATRDTCALIEEGERLLSRGAQQQAASRRWTMHAANVLVNVGFGLILGVGYDHWVAAAVNFAIGAVFGEVTLFTLPSRLISAWAEYQRGGLEPAPVSFQLVPLLRPDGAGLGLAGTF